MILRVHGGVLRGASGVGQFSELVRQREGSVRALEIPIGRGSVSGRAVHDRRSVHVHDLAAEREDEYPVGRELQRRFGHRSMPRHAFASSGCTARSDLPFQNGGRAVFRKTDRAAQHLRRPGGHRHRKRPPVYGTRSSNAELTRSVGELKALGEVGQAVSSTLDLETVLSTIVSRATQLAGMDGGAIYEYDEARARSSTCARRSNLPDELVAALAATPVRKGEGAVGRMAATREPVQFTDIADDRQLRQPSPRDPDPVRIPVGSRCAAAARGPPARRPRGPPEERRRVCAAEVIDLLKTFATQSALAIQNARLFREIEIKSRQLEVASQHKSEFLANMSHELRTPLNAIIGFSEVLSERMFGEINEKQAEYLDDILESGRHLLSLINDILDLSKIEAGRMELELTDFDLPSAIENTLTLVRERAHRRGIALGRTVDERLGMVRADERKVKQVLLEPPVQRAEVHAGGRADRCPRQPYATARQRFR